MSRTFKTAIATLLAISTVGTAMPVSAQNWNDRGRDRHEWRGDRDDDRGGDHDRGRGHDRGHHYGWGHERGWDRGHERDEHRWRYYGGNYGYNGYDGRWRTGQRYPYWRDHGYYINDYRSYGLPPPRYGYRYYRADNGDIVMAAIAGGVIGLIIGGAFSH